MGEHWQITSAEDARKLFPLPWKVFMFKDDCWGIKAANGRLVVITDSGYYPPDKFTAQMIVDAVNGTAGTATTGK